MKALQNSLRLALIVVAVVVAPAADATAGDTRARSDAASETREALDAYRDALRDELDQLKQGLARLENKAKAALADRPDTKRRLDKLRDEHAAAQRRLEELGDQAGRTWDDLKARMDSVVDDLQRRYDDESETL